MSFIHCKHWNGRDMFLGDERKCKAGVDPIYSFCGGQMTGWVRKVPCLRTNETDAICPAAEYPTKEEAEQEAADREAWMDAALRRITVVRPLIVATQKETGAWSGTLDCPECSKPLRWSMAQSNRHIHACCETDNCVSWME